LSRDRSPRRWRRQPGRTGPPSAAWALSSGTASSSGDAAARTSTGSSKGTPIVPAAAPSPASRGTWRLALNHVSCQQGGEADGAGGSVG
jgi:hypothetical protein